jgi:hypothetical protein
MRDRQPSADLSEQIRDIVDENRHVQVGGPPGTRPDAPRIGTTSKPNIGDPDQLAHLPGHRDEPTGRIDLVRDPKLPPPPTGDTLTSAIVLQKINATYMAGLQRCYRKGMLHDASLAGKVAISFTVDEHGRLIEPKASGMTTEVDACIQGFMPSWRFPFPRDKDGDPSQPSFAMSLMLRPS